MAEGVSLFPHLLRGDTPHVTASDQTAITITAIDLLPQRAEKPEPFFLAVGFVRPHFHDFGSGIGRLSDFIASPKC